MQQVFYSNRLESLYEALRDSLFSSNAAPFARRIIVVPSPAMKSWLMLQMSKDPKLGIAMGIETITHLDQSVVRLCDWFGHPISHITSLDIALAIEQEIRTVISGWNLLSQVEQETWHPLLQYLKVDSSLKITKQTERRLTPLCITLSTLFIQYGIYAGEMVREWEPDSGWQQALWLRLFATNRFTYPHDYLKTLINEPLCHSENRSIQFHLFAFSHISKLYHDFFLNVAKVIPVQTYVLSPCYAFWSDLLSSFESHKLQSYWKKRGASPAQQQALEQLLRDCNPLLANFGRLGRERAIQLEESHAISIESYTIPKQTISLNCYQELITDDLLLEDHSHPLTLLEAIQTDMAVLRNPDHSAAITFTPNDDSVQIHIAPSRMREVQILYDAILALLDKHFQDSQPMTPGDILVMAPDINKYSPYIKAVFEGHESLLGIQMSDLEMPLQSSLVQGLQLLIELPFSRWNATAFLQLLNHPAFQKRQGFSGEEVNSIREWIRTTNVRWGEDAAHRDELLKRTYCDQGMVENSSIGTWEYSFGRLLAGLALNTKDSPLDPLDILDSIQGHLLGKWMQILRGLRCDLECLYDGSQKTLAEWDLFLRCLCDGYLEADDKSEKDALFALIYSFSQASQKLGDNSFPFSTIHQHIMEQFSIPKNSYREQSLNAVRFCSLLPMRAIPAKVVVLMGMEEGAFPRQEVASSLDLSAHSTKKDYSPSKTDYDRFLFLEMLLSARRYLLITYTGFSLTDDKEVPPALVVTELLKYMNQAYANTHCVYKHPHHPFDSSYFASKSKVKSYSRLQYRAAQAFYQVEKHPQTGFFNSFALNSTTEGLFTRHIDIKDLMTFARNPIKAYCNKTLGIFLDSAEKREVKDEEDFHLSALQNHIVQKQSLTHSMEHVLSNAHREGHLPIGAFKSTAIERIQNEIIQLKQNLLELSVHPKDIFSICSSDQVSQTIYEAQQWQMPSLKIPYQNGVVHISGTLPEVALQGLITRCKDDKIEILKIWPQFLFLSCLKQTFDLPISQQLLMIKGSKPKSKSLFSDDPCKLMTQYLDYYFLALESPSPLIPEWVPAFFEQNASSLQERMRMTLTNPFHPLHNDYLKWATFDGAVVPDAGVVMVHWKPWAESLYGDLYHHWYSR